MMKSGANKLDQSAIRQFEKQGNDASWISDKMQIPESCVKNFMAKHSKPKEPELSPQQRAANTRKANAEAAAGAAGAAFPNAA